MNRDFRQNRPLGFWVSEAALATAISIVVACATPAWADTTVSAPCTQSASATGGLRSCDDYLNHGGSTAPTGPGALALLKQRVSDQILGNPPGLRNTLPYPGVPTGLIAPGYYQHFDPNPVPSMAPGKYFGPTICNLVPGPFNNNTAEGLTIPSNNQAGDPCGNPVVINNDGFSDYTISIDKKWNADPTKANGTLEDGYLRGALAAATTCFYNQVDQELTNNHTVTVSDTSPCHALAQAFVSQSGQLNSSMNTLKTLLTGQANIGDIMNCTNSWDPSTNTANGVDVGPLRQSAQLLCSVRDAVETMFTQLAVCEAFQRAQTSWNKHTSSGSPTAQQEITALFKQIGTDCKNACKSKNGWSWHSIPSASDVSKCAQGCYNNGLSNALSAPHQFQNHIQNLWPSNVGGQCALGLIPLWVPRRKRRRRTAGRKRRVGRRGWTAIACVALMVSLAGLSMGCGGGSMPNINTDTPPSQCGGDITTQSSDCCGANPPSTCSARDAGGGGVQGALLGAASAGNTGTVSLANANSLLGHAPGTSTAAGSLAQGQAASAGNALLSTPPGSASSNPSSSLGSGASSSSPSSAMGAAGAGLGNGSDMSGFGALQTTAATGSNNPSSSAELAAAQAGGTYTSGNGAGGTPGSNRASDNSIEGTGTNGDLSFGQDNGESGRVLATDDPADYFTRLGLEENIFKVVERRYRQKSMAWATQSLVPKAAAPQAPQKTGALK